MTVADASGFETIGLGIGLTDFLAVTLGVFVSVFTGKAFGADNFSGAATHLVGVAVETCLDVDFAV